MRDTHIHLCGTHIACASTNSSLTVRAQLTAFIVDGNRPWDGVFAKKHFIRRVVRTLYWITVTAVPITSLILLNRPWSNFLGETANEYFIGVFSVPLLLMLIMNLVFMLMGVEDATYGNFPYSDDGPRTFYLARRRFFWGLALLLLAVSAWLATEGLCDTTPFFRVFPGHALFHVLMAYGLMQCLVYPSILRASFYSAHPRFLSESSELVPSRDGTCLHAAGRAVALCYLTLFPAGTRARSCTHCGTRMIQRRCRCVAEPSHAFSHSLRTIVWQLYSTPTHRSILPSGIANCTAALATARRTALTSRGSRVASHGPTVGIGRPRRTAGRRTGHAAQAACSSPSE